MVYSLFRLAAIMQGIAKRRSTAPPRAPRPSTWPQSARPATSLGLARSLGA
jgi:hypothetical protein